MAQPQTIAEKTLRRIGAARGNLAFLGQSEPSRLNGILGRYATQYRMPLRAMTRESAPRVVTSDDCAAALTSNLDRLTVDASFIRGINRVDSRVINSHLHALAAECASFVLAQTVDLQSGAEVSAAMHRFLERGLGSGSFAGSARG
jgi:hypothetical protein